MRIAFMGTPDFAVPSLERLYEDGHVLACVFTQPDKPRNRGMKVSLSPIKEVAVSHGTQVYQPTSLRSLEVAKTIKELDCDAIAVVAYGKLLPRAILDMPPLGCINIHASLLPKYRGAAPIQWAILNGEAETGVTSIYMADEIDAGDIIFQKTVSIGDGETSGDLHDRLSILGADLLSETLDAVACNNAVRTPQDNEAVTFAPQLDKGKSPIDWSDTAFNIKRHVCGLNPWPVATAVFGGSVFKVFSVDIGDIASTNAQPGEIVSGGRSGLHIKCCDGTIVINELQAPGGKRMLASEYMKGHRFEQN